ncbi:DUF4276 family protein [Geothrix sp. PMB-07]|uniref:DUF4276 family protein n=1 Tax=Geothrix sp. PMB-07 TaxID=3068640 RepID=UPI00274189CB|nr:DUF4276 family protein [Geothrix sp. PMB-07]WLT30643.1 DUF4276 family protein [Geothrix sp. PMB-07]
MKVHVLVEGKSDKAFIDGWAPRAFRGHSFQTHAHQGKGTLPRDPSAPPLPRRQGLLDLLPAKLRAFAAVASENDHAVLVLVDADDENCEILKQNLVEISNSQAPSLNVVFRIAVEESEAFYLGDLRALKLAFPQADMQKAQAYRPDSVCGTAELFCEIVGDGTMDKVSWAEKMGPRMTILPEQSRSPSFRALHAGIEKLTTQTVTEPKSEKRKYRHLPRTSPIRRQR